MYFVSFIMLLLASPAWSQKELGAFPNRGVVGEQKTDATRLSSAAQMLIGDLQKLGHDVRRNDKLIIERYALQRKCCRYYVQAMVQMASGHKAEEFRKRS